MRYARSIFRRGGAPWGGHFRHSAAVLRTAEAHCGTTVFARRAVPSCGLRLWHARRDASRGAHLQLTGSLLRRRYVVGRRVVEDTHRPLACQHRAL